MKLLVGMGSSKKDYIAFPAEVQDEMGYALYQAQIGKTPRQAKVLKGFGGGGVIELRARDTQSNAYRTVYAANLEAPSTRCMPSRRRRRRGSRRRSGTST